MTPAAQAEALFLLSDLVDWVDDHYEECEFATQPLVAARGRAFLECMARTAVEDDKLLGDLPK